MILNTLQSYFMQLSIHKKNPQNKPAPKFAAFMLLFRQQSYFKPRWATLPLQENFLQFQDAAQTWPLA